jgi:hypothetical protein
MINPTTGKKRIIPKGEYAGFFPVGKMVIKARQARKSVRKSDVVRVI